MCLPVRLCPRRRLIYRACIWRTSRAGGGFGGQCGQCQCLYRRGRGEGGDGYGAGAAAALSCKPAQVYVASTGVIGEDLPTEPLLDGINAIARRFAAKPRAGFTGHNDHKAWLAAARAMMTTDTFPKLASQTARLGGKTVTLNGIAKGSGMIAPDMATMLAFVVTDAAIPARVLQSLLAQANETSFNAITVDGDTSTSDTCLLFATGVHALGGAPLRSANDKRLAGFKKALHALMQDLAVQTVSDGEGAGKLMVIDIAGAKMMQRRGALVLCRQFTSGQNGCGR